MKSAAAQAAAEVEHIAAAPDKTKPAKKPRPKRQPRYAVILHNDDVNTAEFVVGVLQKVLHYDQAKAFQLMLRAHVSGRSAVWTGVLEVAELKADQIRSCGCDPLRAADGAGPLRVTVEPLPES
ncbi:MAG: ATP-dependent Clp protease adaptor ClpS [Pirellulaceae bacterium]